MSGERGSMVLGVLCGAAAGAFWGLVFLAPELARAFGPLELTIGRYLAYGLISAALIAPRWRGLAGQLGAGEWRALALLALVRLWRVDVTFTGTAAGRGRSLRRVRFRSGNGLDGSGGLGLRGRVRVRTAGGQHAYGQRCGRGQGCDLLHVHKVIPFLKSFPEICLVIRAAGDAPRALSSAQSHHKRRVPRAQAPGANRHGPVGKTLEKCKQDG